MDKKINLSQLADMLSQQGGMSKSASEQFVKTFFDIISNTVLQEGLVKVKGFGTFKLLQMEDRESVNVNTGERFTIEGHQKISFTPDAELKERIAVMEKAEKSLKARSRSNVMRGTTYKKSTPIGTAYITVNSDNDSYSYENPFEVFINVAKVGTSVAADAEGLARLISLILRMPSPYSPKQRAQAIINQLKGIGSGQSTGFGKNRVMSLADAVAQVLEEHIGTQSEATIESTKLTDEGEEEEKSQPELISSEYVTTKAPLANGITRDICPVCGNATFVKIEGCQKCLSCGYSKC